MATPVRIGILLSDGTIRSSYQRTLGYYQNTGSKLIEHYSTEQSASSLIDGGDMVNCYTNYRWTTDGNVPIDPPGPDYYSYRNLDLPPKIHQDLNEYLEYTFSSDNDSIFAYLFENSEWFIYTPTRHKLTDLVVSAT
jgi:hypothetical protein